jgi:hypothetical protein
MQIETDIKSNGGPVKPAQMSGELEVAHRFSPETILGATVVAVATLGAFSRYLNQYLKSGKFSWRELVANYVVSMFTAFMFALFIYSFWPGVSPAIIILSAGTGSYFGDKAMVSIFDFFRAQVKLQQNQPEEEEQNPKTRTKKRAVHAQDE